MIVYGDHPTSTTLAALHARTLAHLAAARAAPPGLARHEALVAAFLTHAETTRALADVHFADDGEDRPHANVDALMADLVHLARAVAISWRSHFRRTPVPAPRAHPPDRAVITKPAEGFAFYALYPEAVYETARALALPTTTQIIGLRGIGSALAAMAAAAIRRRTPPITLRPTGHPFARAIAAAPPPPAPAALIVDEGPGLSGSSFTAAARWIEAGGTRLAMIAFLPSHPHPPGAMATAETRARWHATTRAPAEFDTTILPRLPGWVEHLVDEPITGWRDLSGGVWAFPLPAPLRSASLSLTGEGGPFTLPRESGRGTAPAQGEGGPPQPPPTDPPRERRKYLATTPTARYLVKFTGLGDIGQTKLARARALGSLIPEPIGLAHGFLVERWIDPGPPAPPTATEIARYLAARTRLAPSNPGAPLATLIAMAHSNIAEGLGPQAAAAFAHHAQGAHTLPSCAVATDNRLHLWEWLRAPDGRLLKTDALDHCEGHDLIGCQDIAWDIAGAGVELGLDPAPLIAALATDRRLVALHRLLYPAFQLGLWTMAGHPRAAFYADHLARALSAGPPPAAAGR